MINQRFDHSHEAHSVGQARVLLEGCSIAPTRMNVELIAVSDRLERLVTQAARFLARWTLNLLDGLPHLVLTRWPRVKAGEKEQFHR